MDCSTCINRTSPYKKGYCRTMTAPFPDYGCYMTKAQALEVEYQLMQKCGKDVFKEIKDNIEWLNGLEG